ncbi:MAG: cell division protein ZapA [Ruminococcaceae bacterium]|nr:cell division protein ZapA [Oscillospiraceae bacterium]
MGNTVKVTIAGVNYALKTEETATFTKQLAKELNSKMVEIKNANPYISTNQIAVLLAMEYASNCKKAEQTAEKLKGEMKDYLEDAAKAQSERDFYKREIDRLKEETKAKSQQINLFSDEDE